MSDHVKNLAVRTVKPVVSDQVWEKLRSVAGRASALRTSQAPTPQQRRRRSLRAMNLTDLGREFKTDKAGTHKFTQHYEHHLEHLRGTTFNLLEIGIGGAKKSGAGGASLRMWKHYFSNAQIVGLDIEDKSFVRAPRIHTFQGSQVDEALLVKMNAEHGPFEVIIDDGSHRPEHIRETFRILFPLLVDGGVYAIEDTQTSYWPEWGGSEDLASPTTTMALVKDLVDGLNYEEYVDESYEPSYTDRNVVAVHAYHNLVILEKGENAEGTARRRILRERYAAQSAR